MIQEDVTKMLLDEFEHCKNTAATFGDQRWVKRLPAKVTREDLSFIPQEGLKDTQWSRFLIYGLSMLHSKQKAIVVAALKKGILAIYRTLDDKYWVTRVTSNEGRKSEFL